MSDPSSDRDVFDVQHIRRLIELMNEHDLQEIDLQQGVRVGFVRRVASAGGADAVRPPGRRGVHRADYQSHGRHVLCVPGS